MGLIDQPAPDVVDPAAATPEAAVGNDVLEQARQKFEEQVPDQYKDALQRVVLAGKKVLYSKESHPMVEQELAGGDPIASAGTGAAELMGLLVKESRGTMPKQVVAPAMMILLTDVLDYLKQTGRAKGDGADLEKATESLSQSLMQAAGISPEGFQQILTKAHETLKDPAMKAKMEGAQNGT